MVSSSDKKSVEVWVRLKLRVGSGWGLCLMLHDEGNMEDRCADSDRRHVKVPQVRSARKIINSLQH